MINNLYRHILCEIPTLTDTTDHALLIWGFGILFSLLFMIVIVVVAWMGNKIIILWEAHIAGIETRKADVKEFNELKASVDTLDASVKHLDKTIANKDPIQATINHKSMELLYKIADRLEIQ